MNVLMKYVKIDVNKDKVIFLFCLEPRWFHRQGRPSRHAGLFGQGPDWRIPGKIFSSQITTLTC